MLVNSTNESLLLPHHSVINLYSSQINCLIGRPNSFMAFYLISIIIIFPLCMFILGYGLKQWRSTSSAAMSHCDCFTYHMAIMELVGVFNCVISCWGIGQNDRTVLSVKMFLMTFFWHGQIFLHLLTCVERYLAVAHPVFYMSLRNERGIRARNVILASVWVLCCIAMGFLKIQEYLALLDLCIIFLTFAGVLFCSVKVLCILIRPGPGEQGGDRERVDQSKRRAFYIIVTILGVLMVKIAWNLVWVFLIVSQVNEQCLMMQCSVLLDLLCSLVLPLLFLHRKGKLVCCGQCKG